MSLSRVLGLSSVFAAGAAGIMLAKNNEKNLLNRGETDMGEMKAQNVRLLNKRRVSPDSYIFQFDTSPKSSIGFRTGDCLVVHAPNDVKDNKGKRLSRPYTPINQLNDESGHVDLLIKVYSPTKTDEYGGQMSQYLEKLNIGDKVSVSGPYGSLTYEKEGKFLKRNKNREEKMNIKEDNLANYDTIQTENVVMICGGSGITPMLQMIKQILKDEKKPPKIHLAYSNKKENDILVRSELECLSMKFPEKFFCDFFLTREQIKNGKSKAPLCGGCVKDGSATKMISECENRCTYNEPSIMCSQWNKISSMFKQSNQLENVQLMNGRIGKKDVQRLVKKSKETIYLICGPKSFTNDMKDELKNLNVKESNIHCY
ncbi:hypothetical protein SNEBB_009007 [Seison nebaliae]|nr:hypothetical protein SNEBB_009007 [Seison nebaliae]